GKTANELEGTYTASEAVQLLLDDTGVEYRIDVNGTLLVGNESVRTQDEPGQEEERSFRVAQVDQEDDVEAVEVLDVEDEESRQDVIVVTGTNIRGMAPESSPVFTYDRDDILNSGASTAEGFIQTLSQNFGGGANSVLPVGVGDDANSNFNVGANGGALGTGVNLRGLGSGSTLVLLNGRRVAQSSAIGDFVDISMIPASAIERVEVLTDGASSIYGGDAVAGVVNFILRDDFEGVETTLRYGTVTEGDMDEARANVTVGKSWDKGNGILVYEYFDQTDLSAADRSFSAGAVQPNDLIPSQGRQSILGSISHELTPSLKVSADASFATRTTVQNTRNNIATFVGNTEAKSDNFNAGFGAEWKVFDDWYLNFAGSYSSVTSESDNAGVVALSSDIESDLWSADIVASGPIFSLPAGDVSVAVGTHFRTEDFTSEVVQSVTFNREADRDVYAVFGEILVPLVAPEQKIPGIHRLEVNLSGRMEDYSDFGSASDPKVGVLWAPMEPLRFRGTYNTSFKPPSLGRVGASDLGAAVISTGFVNFLLGQTAPDPSIANVVLLSASGTDKNLDPETSTAYTLGVDYNQAWGKHDLSWSATYFDIEFEGRLGTPPIPGNVSPLLVPNLAFTMPEAFPPGSVIFFPTDEERAEIVNSLDFVNALFGDDPNDAEIISLALVTTNLAKSQVSGLDFSLAYGRQLDAGRLSFGIDGTYLEEFSRQAASTTPNIDQLNTLFNPVDLKLRGRVGFSREGLSTNLFLNYVNDYRSDSTTNATDIDSWTTLDLNIAYDTSEEVGSGFLKDTIFRLSVVNMFDENPPSAPGQPELGIFGYDPTNASALGRFVSFEITKKW
ncbi:MAG: TonB-dependent receptor, partial [Pseudomonadota bacterium]